MRAMWVLAALLWYVPGAGVSKTAGIPMIYISEEGLRRPADGGFGQVETSRVVVARAVLV